MHTHTHTRAYPRCRYKAELLKLAHIEISSIRMNAEKKPAIPQSILSILICQGNPIKGCISLVPLQLVAARDSLQAHDILMEVIFVTSKSFLSLKIFAPGSLSCLVFWLRLGAVWRKLGSHMLRITEPPTVLNCPSQKFHEREIHFPYIHGSLLHCDLCIPSSTLSMGRKPAMAIDYPIVSFSIFSSQLMLSIKTFLSLGFPTAYEGTFSFALIDMVDTTE